jgi:hypothetical protein
VILTAVIAGNDGMGLSILKAAAILGEMYGNYLERFRAAIEVIDIDDIVTSQLSSVRILHKFTELDLDDRVFLISNISSSLLRARRLNTFYHLLLERRLPLLNRSFAASPEIEVNKSVMHGVVSGLGIECVPTIEFNPHADLDVLLDAALTRGLKFPLLLKPNRLMMGAGILTCENKYDFEVMAGIIRDLGSDYLIQQFIQNSGDLRVYLSKSDVFGHQLRRAKSADMRSNVSTGGVSSQVELPKELVRNCLRIASHLNADYVVLDWLWTSHGFVFNEMCSTPAGFTGVPVDKRERIACAVLEIARAKLGMKS